MRDMIWEIAKSREEDLTHTEKQAIVEPEELVVARGVSLEAKDSTTKINKFVDVKIANDVDEKGALQFRNSMYAHNRMLRYCNYSHSNCGTWDKEREVC